MPIPLIKKMNVDPNIFGAAMLDRFKAMYIVMTLSKKKTWLQQIEDDVVHKKRTRYRDIPQIKHFVVLQGLLFNKLTHMTSQF
jgi:hypothetical protein